MVFINQNHLTSQLYRGCNLINNSSQFCVFNKSCILGIQGKQCPGTRTIRKGHILKNKIGNTQKSNSDEQLFPKMAIQIGLYKRLKYYRNRHQSKKHRK